jgi:hypothetical protein
MRSRHEDVVERLRALNPVPAPVEPDWEQISSRLRPLEIAEATGRRARRAPRVGLRGWILAATLRLAVAAGVLLAVAPWSSVSPDFISKGFLAKAAAALAPQPGDVLYESWERIVAPEPGGFHPHGARFGPERIWIDEQAPRRYRTILRPDLGPPPISRLGGARIAQEYGVIVGFTGGGRGGAPGASEVLDGMSRALAGGPLELGGSLEDPSGKPLRGAILPTLTYLPSGQLLRARMSVTLGAVLPGPGYGAVEDGADPVSVLRDAIVEGRAREAGTARFRGRTVLRIDISRPDHLPPGAPPLPANAPRIHLAQPYAYVEPKTFHPVEMVWGGESYRFLAYGYLPPNAANLALVSVQAQHPHAQVVNDVPGVGGR